MGGGWEGATVESQPLVLSEADSKLYMRVSPEGRDMRVVTSVDGEALGDVWYQSVTAADVRGSSSARQRA